MKQYGSWEQIERLGEGGQSEVFLVRSQARQAERQKCLEDMMEALALSRPSSSVITRLPPEQSVNQLATSLATYTRPDLTSELGALKVFKIPPRQPDKMLPPPDSEEYEAVKRLENEINALQHGWPGLAKLFDFNVDERWMVTEYFPDRTLEHQPTKYRGRALAAVKVFTSLVETIEHIHKDGYVHRDIKPANVFIRKDDELVLGDFGIVYKPDATGGLTKSTA